MKKILILLLALTSFVSCASNSDIKNPENVEDILDQAESSASVGGRRVLESSRTMIANQDVVVGGCWHYINAVYDRAGFPSNQRETVFKSKFNGPYLTTDIFQPGDWLYFVNHSYKDTEHSAIFIAWMDKEKKDALTISYVGGNQKKPGTYKRFIIDKVYNVFRPKE